MLPAWQWRIVLLLSSQFLPFGAAGIIILNVSLIKFSIQAAMLLKQDSSAIKPHATRRLPPSPQLHSLPPSAKQNMISHRALNAPAATKRLSLLQSPRHTHSHKGARLAGGSLFRAARRVDAYNPKESFLPLESNIRADNAAKIKIVLTAYSKLRGRPSGASWLKKSSKTERVSRGEEGRQGVEEVPSLFCQPAPSSLTRLILHHCNPCSWENELDGLDLEASLEGLLGREQELADWINMLCASSIAPTPQSDPSPMPQDNPYEFPRKKTHLSKQGLSSSSRVGVGEYFPRA